ncbi:MAG: 6-bladed beta-propeller [Tannerella sp.]|jgi:hypothetical protein|nr:6-bladed beta-propeller [Tannerella sp.]
MKRISTITSIILFAMMAGCGGGKQSTDDLIIVDVTTSYPEKELILQDFMDVEYIVLETSDEFLTQGLVKAIGSEYILVTNRIRNGDIIIYDRKTGKGVRKINRQGQGPEEYNRISGVANIILDEANGEMFVKSTADKILVYDLYGKFKRSFMSSHYDVFEYDKDNLIGYDISDFYQRGEDRDREKAYHVLISKLDGSITRKIFIPFKTIHTPIVVRMGIGNASTPEFCQIIPNQGKWILADSSSDTLYTYAPDNTLKPFLVRTPSIHAMEPEVYLSIMALTNSYYFIKTVKNDFDFETGRGFNLNTLMYDKKENAVLEYVVYNDDYTEKRPLFKFMWNPYNHEITSSVILEAHQLVDDYKKGILKGKLKEIAATLDEEDNPVIMLVKHKQ